MNFDPADYVNSGDVGNIEMLLSSEDAALKDFSEKVLGDLSTKKVLAPIRLNKVAPRGGDPLHSFRGGQSSHRASLMDSQDISIAGSQSQSITEMGQPGS